jgi:hypothetical protein
MPLSGDMLLQEQRDGPITLIDRELQPIRILESYMFVYHALFALIQ